MNFFDESISLYVALAVAVAVWLVLFVYLWRVDAQARELRRRLDERREGRAAPQPRATLTPQPRPDAEQPGTR